MNLSLVSGVSAQNLSASHWPDVVSLRAGYSLIND